MTHYPVGVTTYDTKSIIDVEDTQQKGGVDKINSIGYVETEKMKNESQVDTVYKNRFIFLFYSTTDVKISTTSLRVDLNTFVSNVGGSLGLFIGFSVLGGFFFVYDLIASESILND